MTRVATYRGTTVYASGRSRNFQRGAHKLEIRERKAAPPGFTVAYLHLLPFGVIMSPVS